jgi:hypothetical protein
MQPSLDYNIPQLPVFTEAQVESIRAFLAVATKQEPG